MLASFAAANIGAAVMVALIAVTVFGVISFLQRRKEPPVAGKVGWNAWEAVSVTVAIYALAQVVAGIVIAPILALTGLSTDALEESVVVQFAFVAAVEAYSVGMVYLFLRNRKTAWRAIGLVRPRGMDIAYAVIGFFLYMLGYIALTMIVDSMFPQVDLEQRQELGFSTQAAGLALIPIFISLVVLPPLVEEIMARGVLYSGLRTRLSVAVSAVITSILFAAAHLQFGSGNALLWVAAIDTFVLSLVLVALRERTGSLWPAIFLHGIKNCIAFMALFIWRLA